MLQQTSKFLLQRKVLEEQQHVKEMTQTDGFTFFQQMLSTHRVMTLVRGCRKSYNLTHL